MTLKQAIMTAVCLGSFSAVGVVAGDYRSTEADIQDPSMESAEDENLQAETRGEVRTNADLNNDGIIDENEVTTEVPASFGRDSDAESWDEDDESAYDSDPDLEDSADQVSP